MDAIEQECRRGHRDLRKTVSELEAQVDVFEHDLKALDKRVSDSAEAPIDSPRIRFSGQALYILGGLTITIVITVLGAAASMRSDMRNINTRMDADSKLSDQRYNEITKAIERQEKQRSDDKAAAETRLKKYDNDEMLRDMGLKGPKK